jgi:hypothetical protein
LYLACIAALVFAGPGMLAVDGLVKKWAHHDAPSGRDRRPE